MIEIDEKTVQKDLAIAISFRNEMVSEVQAALNRVALGEEMVENLKDELRAAEIRVQEADENIADIQKFLERRRGDGHDLLNKKESGESESALAVEARPEPPAGAVSLTEAALKSPNKEYSQGAGTSKSGAVSD